MIRINSLAGETVGIGTPYFNVTLRKTYELLFKSGITIVNAKGNRGWDELVYPVDFRDDWVISVGASGMNGSYLQTNVDIPELTNTFNGFSNQQFEESFTSNFGNGVDVIAPGTIGLNMTTVASTNPIAARCHVGQPEYEKYNCFNGTSTAAPHVTGLAALIWEHYDDGPNLSIEDIEHLIEYGATDIFAPDNAAPWNYSASYDEYNGWGRINAEATLQLFDANHDNLKVIHVNVNGANVTMPPGCEDGIFPNSNDDCHFGQTFFEYPFESVLSGNMIGVSDINEIPYNYFKKTHTAPFELNLCDFGGDANTVLATFIDSNKIPYWERNSDAAVDLWGIETPHPSISNTEIILPEDRILIENLQTSVVSGCTIIEGVLKGYSYVVYSFDGSVEELPKPSTTPDVFSFSLLLDNSDNVDNEININHIPDMPSSVVTIQKNTLNIKAIPNPTTDQLQVMYELNQQSNIQIQITNLNGQILQRHKFGKLPSGKQSHNLNISKLPIGVYLCRLQTEENTSIIKIIKL